jgi:MFS family permease
VDAAGFFYIVYAIVVLAARPLIGRLFDSKGENLIMYSAILSFAIGMVVFSNARFGWMLLTSAALIGFGFGAVQTGGQAIAVKSAETASYGSGDFNLLYVMRYWNGSRAFDIWIHYSACRFIEECIPVLQLL